MTEYQRRTPNRPGPANLRPPERAIHRIAPTTLHYRRDAPWEQLTGGLPHPLPYMPYALLTLHNRPGVLIAGLQNGELLMTEDAGDSWRTLDVKLRGLLALAESV